MYFNLLWIIGSFLLAIGSIIFWALVEVILRATGMDRDNANVLCIFCCIISLILAFVLAIAPANNFYQFLGNK